MPMPRHLRGAARAGIESALADAPDAAQTEYRRLLHEEAEMGDRPGQMPPAVRALNRLLGGTADGRSGE